MIGRLTTYRSRALLLPRIITRQPTAHVGGNSTLQWLMVGGKLN